MKDWLSAAAVLIVLTVVTLLVPESDKGEVHSQDLNFLYNGEKIFNSI